MIHPDNARRIKRAQSALKKYSSLPEDGTGVIDLLADLRHFCEAAGIDYDNCDRIARAHFTEECNLNTYSRKEWRPE